MQTSTKTNELTPGEATGLDIQKNPTELSPTKDTFFPYYLQLTDIASRSPWLFGLQTLSMTAVLNAIQC
jgi:hypothetical protein